MSSYFPNGAKYAISAPLGIAAAISAITNAKPPVATASTPAAVGDVVLVSVPGWPGINNQVAVAGSPTANSFQLLGHDTTDEDRFFPGDGVGVYQTAGSFTAIDQIREIGQSGGEQQYFTYSYIDDESNTQLQKPTFKNPRQMTLTMDYDPAKAWFSRLEDADRNNDKVLVVRERLKDGTTIYYAGYPSFNNVPSKTSFENMTNVFTLSLISPPVRIPAA